MDILVSVAIPVYNAEDTIKDTIESVITQTYTNLEIIIIDNQSSDRTVDIIKGFNDERIVFFQNDTNLGMVGNWNECIKHATGDYIHFLCADDRMRADCIEKKVAAITECDAVLTMSATEIVNENEKVVMRRQRFKKDTVLDGYRYAKKSLRTGNIYGEPSSVMFKREVIEKTGLFATNLYYTTDWELWIRISVLGKIVYLSEVLSYYRISMNNTTGTLKLKKIMDDDTAMMNNLKKYDGISISLFDTFFHKVVLSLRDVARVLYMRYKSN